jgi:hypothetical protein
MEKQGVDKLYIKKHKINDLLNELFISITKEKPENPLEFGMQFFEAKLPPEKRKKVCLLSL